MVGLADVVGFVRVFRGIRAGDDCDRGGKKVERSSTIGRREE